MGLHKAIIDSVGKNGKNNKFDISIIIMLLNDRKHSPYYYKFMSKILIPRPTDKDIENKLEKAIFDFQRTIQKLKKPDGQVGPNGTTIYFLGGVRRNQTQIIVELDDQNLFAYEGNRKRYEYHSTSGDRDHPTAIIPQLFHIFRKHKKYTSRTYNAKMDYAMFFTDDGKAIHQANGVWITSILKNLGANSFGSHGCVRLSESNAKELFDWAPMNTPVFIDMV
jgi:lipoprotein-anchoring transpeptidase ErfK/SrfK